MTNQTETTKPEAPTEAGGQVERVVICEQPKEQEPVLWSCGWCAPSARCLRFHCHRSGPCGGYSGR